MRHKSSRNSGRLRNCANAGVCIRKTPSRDRVGICTNNRILNNVIVECGVAFDYDIMDNVSDYNTLSRMSDAFDLSDWQKSGLDEHSTTVELDVAVAPDASLVWSAPTDPAPEVRRDELLSVDYFGRPYPGDDITVGPFIEGWSTSPRMLKLSCNGRNGAR